MTTSFVEGIISLIATAFAGVAFLLMLQ